MAARRAGGRPRARAARATREGRARHVDPPRGAARARRAAGARPRLARRERARGGGGRERAPRGSPRSGARVGGAAAGAPVRPGGRGAGRSASCAGPTWSTPTTAAAACGCGSVPRRRRPAARPHLHGLPEPFLTEAAPSLKARVAYRGLDRGLRRFTDVLVTPSHAMARAAGRARRLRRRRARRRAQRRRRARRAAPAGDRVGTIALLEPVKGLEYLIEAARLLPGTRFVIFGTGSQEAELRERAAGLPSSSPATCRARRRCSSCRCSCCPRSWRTARSRCSRRWRPASRWSPAASAASPSTPRPDRDARPAARPGRARAGDRELLDDPAFAAERVRGRPCRGAERSARRTAERMLELYTGASVDSVALRPPVALTRTRRVACSAVTSPPAPRSSSDVAVRPRRHDHGLAGEHRGAAAQLHRAAAARALPALDAHDWAFGAASGRAGVAVASVRPAARSAWGSDRRRSWGRPASRSAWASRGRRGRRGRRDRRLGAWASRPAAPSAWRHAGVRAGAVGVGVGVPSCGPSPPPPCVGPSVPGAGI